MIIVGNADINEHKIRLLMPVNKNAFVRYQLLDYCFRNKRYNIDNLVDYVSDKLGYNISLRQIREDISNMKLDPYDALLRQSAIMATNLIMCIPIHPITSLTMSCLRMN